MKKRFLSLLLATVVLAGATGCGQAAKKKEEAKPAQQAATSAEKTKLTIADVDLNDPKIEEQWKKEPRYGTKLIFAYNGGLCTSGLGIAKVKGFLEKEGLEAEIQNIPNAMDAIGTGKADANTDHISTSLVPAVNGVNAVFTRGAQTGCKSLYVLKDSDIQKTSDLIGKQVAIHDAIGGSDHNIALRFFARDKVDQAKLKFKVIETAATVQAMQNGEVQASIFSDQFAKKFVDQGLLRPIRSITFDDDFKVEPCCVLILNKDFVEQNPITAAKLTRAHKAASDWIEENKQEASAVINANHWGSGNVESDRQFLETYNFKVSDEQAEKSLINVIEDYKTFKLINSYIKTDEALAKVWRPMKHK